MQYGKLTHVGANLIIDGRDDCCDVNSVDDPDDYTKNNLSDDRSDSPLFSSLRRYLLYKWFGSLITLHGKSYIDLMN